MQKTKMMERLLGKLIEIFKLVKFKISAWLENVSAPAEVFPYADNYDASAEGQWELEKVKSDCSFGEFSMVFPPL